MAFVEFRDVRKVYRMGEVEVAAVDGMTFDIERGELVVVVGPSGAGKTTLLNMLGGMDACSSGTIMLDGREISALSEDEIREVARVVREEGFESVAVTSVFSPVSDAHEKRAAAVLREELGEGFPITLSSEIGSLGFLERENASILNAALYDQFAIRAMVSKDSGAAGGAEEKVLPALARDIHVILIRRPKEAEDAR